MIAERDPTAFRHHSLDLQGAMRIHGRAVDLLDLFGMDHFDVIERLREPDYVLVARIMRETGLQ